MDSNLHHVFVKISPQKLLYNLSAIKAITNGRKIMAVLKKNAYGHDAILVARALAGKVDCLGLIYPHEGIALRKAGIKIPILIFGAILPSEVPVCIEHDLQFPILSTDHLNGCIEEARRLGAKAQVHLKIDSGMGRIGMRWDDCLATMKQAIEAPEIQVNGIFTHLACADTPQNSYTPIQERRFRSAFAQYPDKKPTLHMAASGGILHYPETHFDMVRPGHILYGVYPDKNATRKLDIQPVLSLHAKIVFSKKVKAGDYVGYGNVFRAERDTWIATIPIGYGDGFPRKLTARGRVLVRGRSFPIASSVCMDQLMIDCGDCCLEPGEEVVLIGQQGDQEITVEEIANLLDTVPDDILSNINPNIPRIIIS